MNTMRVVFGLVAAVTWLVCANTAEDKVRTCTLFCPEGQVLNISACRCDPINVVVTPKRECPLLNCLTTSPSCLIYRRNPTTGCRTCECLFPAQETVPRPCGLVCREGEELNLTICKCVKAKECPLRKCAVGSPPCLAYRIDESGCRTCECLFRCPVRKCPASCTTGVEYFVDEFGCDSCRCKQPPSCGNVTCRLYCAEGYEQDSNGCDICKCKPCGNLCEIGCKHGKLVDFDGCEMCECKLKPECGPVCSNVTCEHGRVLDTNGCPTCQCVSKQPCGPVGKTVCPHGRVYDKYGCPTCTCLPEPTCPPFCTNVCEFGRVVDKNGCLTCTCTTKPY